MRKMTDGRYICQHCNYVTRHEESAKKHQEFDVPKFDDLHIGYKLYFVLRNEETQEAGEVYVGSFYGTRLTTDHKSYWIALTNVHQKGSRKYLTKGTALTWIMPSEVISITRNHHKLNAPGVVHKILLVNE